MWFPTEAPMSTIGYYYSLELTMNLIKQLSGRVVSKPKLKGENMNKGELVEKVAKE